MRWRICITPTTRGDSLPMTPTVNSSPSQNSSTSAGPPYPSRTKATCSRSAAGVVTREASRTPLLEPSQAGLTISGKARPPGASPPGRSASRSTSRWRGVASPREATTRLARSLSSVSASVSGSEPVQGTPSISQTAGTCASRLRPLRPSAMLKTRSGGSASMPLEEGPPEAEPLDGVPGRRQHLREGVDGGGRVELLGVVDRRPGHLGDLVAQVVGDPDPHATRAIFFVRMIFELPAA